eukprot:COSAG02_NODE_24384_length_690_cov_0.873096_1_plen_147_part_10
MTAAGGAAATMIVIVTAVLSMAVVEGGVRAPSHLRARAVSEQESKGESQPARQLPYKAALAALMPTSALPGVAFHHLDSAILTVQHKDGCTPVSRVQPQFPSRPRAHMLHCDTARCHYVVVCAAGRSCVRRSSGSSIIVHVDENNV